MSDLYERIYAVVRQIPQGKVASYGQISKLTGTTARQVGYAMAALSQDSKIPWQRLVNSKGEISRRSRGEGHEYQRLLLEAEGVALNSSGKIDLDRYAWEKTLVARPSNADEEP